MSEFGVQILIAGEQLEPSTVAPLFLTATTGIPWDGGNLST
jgi:hypothetical protein